MKTKLFSIIFLLGLFPILSTPLEAKFKPRFEVGIGGVATPPERHYEDVRVVRHYYQEPQTVYIYRDTPYPHYIPTTVYPEHQIVEEVHVHRQPRWNHNLNFFWKLSKVFK